MIRFFIGVLLVILSQTAGAQNKPVPPVPPLSPPPQSEVSAAFTVPGNPFAPHAPAKPTTDAAGPSKPTAPSAQVLREEIQKVFRDCGQRIGRVNGDTVFKLSISTSSVRDPSNSYLLLPSRVQDQLPASETNCELAVSAMLPAKPAQASPSDQVAPVAGAASITSSHSVPARPLPMKGRRP